MVSNGDFKNVMEWMIHVTNSNSDAYVVVASESDRIESDEQGISKKYWNSVLLGVAMRANRNLNVSCVMNCC